MTKPELITQRQCTRVRWDGGCAARVVYAESEINGRRVLLSKKVGAGTASGSFDRGGYCV